MSRGVQEVGLWAEEGLIAADGCAGVLEAVSGALLLMMPFIGVLDNEVAAVLVAVAAVLALDVAVLPARVAILGTPVLPPPAGLDDATRGCLLLADVPPPCPIADESIIEVGAGAQERHSARVSFPPLLSSSSSNFF